MLDRKFVPQFNITLRCNMYNFCRYCYVKEQQGKFPLDLDCEDFGKILDWFIMLGVDEIILLGGEPTLHPLFAQVLETLSHRGLSARLFTNGTYNSTIADLVAQNESVETMFFHYDENYFRHSDKLTEKFLKNVEQASASGKKIWLRWNIDAPDTDHATVIGLATKYGANIGYSISVPTPTSAQIPIPKVCEYVASLVDLATSASEKGIELHPARALPLCAFGDQELELLRRLGNLEGTCIAINDITVNTDLSIQLCSVTHDIRTSPVTGVQDLEEKIEFLKGEEAKLRAIPAIPECSECVWFKNAECQGGCYGYKLFG
jgi:sulfatase maturation enzyme AslB (radical SAM superfamily)